MSQSHAELHNTRAEPPETSTSVIEGAFQDFTERKDIAILLINQHVSLHTATEDSGAHFLIIETIKEHLGPKLTIRLPSGYDLLWIDIKRPSQRYWRFQARNTHTVSRN